MSEYRYFDLKEFACRETGTNDISPAFVKRLDELRDRCGFPFIVTSGYRSPQHTVEQEKPEPGVHTEGIAVDIAISGGTQRRRLVEEALAMDFNGVGVYSHHVHIDDRDDPPVLWVG